ncbi:MAG: hypothetical protein ABI255_08735 [Microbacteriaceae bacterium]
MAMAVMLATMVEMSIGFWVVPQLLWCVILLLLIPLPFLGAHRPYGSMEVQRALSIVAMFALLVIAGPGLRSAPALAPSGHAHGLAAGVAGGWITGNWTLGVGLILFLAFSLAIAAGLFRVSVSQPPVGRPPRQRNGHLGDRVEAASSAFAIAAMAVMVL